MRKKSMEAKSRHGGWGKGIFLAALQCLIGLQEPSAAAETVITPSEVYANAVQIEKEVELFKRHYHITARTSVAPVEADLKPRHIWEECNLIMIKLNILRARYGLEYVAPATIQPARNIEPYQSWAHVQRVLTEMKILRRLLAIPGNTTRAAVIPGKRPIDVFNKLNQISYEMDLLNNATISPPFVYAEAMRLNEDISSIMYKTKTVDTATPPAKLLNAQPKDSLASAFLLMEIIQQLQQKVGVETTDFSVFRKKEDVVPADVLNMVGMCLAEVQTIKAKIGLRYKITPPAEIPEEKSPAEVNQLIGFMANKLRLVKPQ